MIKIDPKINSLIKALMLLLEEKGEAEKERVIKYLIRTLKEKEVNLTLARQFDGKTEEKIKESLKDILGKDKKFNVTVNPEIIGGFTIETKNHFIDCSVKKSIEKIWNSLNI